MTLGAPAPGLVLGAALLVVAACGREPPATPTPSTATAAPLAPRTYAQEKAALDEAIAKGESLVASRPDDGLLPLEVAGLLLERARLTGDYGDFGRAAAVLAAKAPSAGAAAAHCLLSARLDYTLHRLAAAGKRLAACPPQADALEAASLAADIDFHSGRYREAEATYRRLVNGPGLPGHYVRLALHRAKTGAPGEAAALLEAAERRYHGTSATMRAWLKLQRAIVAMDRGRLDEALAILRLAQDAMPGWWLVDEHVAEVLALQGEDGKALAIYRDVVARTGMPEYRDALADLEEKAGRREVAATLRREARAAYEARLTAFPEAAAGHALDHFLGDAAAANRALELALANHRTRPAGEAAIALARAYLGVGQPARAEALLRQEHARGWDTAESHWVLAEALAKRGNDRAAQASREAALARNPTAARQWGP